MHTPITVRQLSYALAVARHGGFKRAAEQLNVSQSAVSEQVKLLEEYLGANLFDRSGTKVQLSVHGKVLLEKAEDVIERINQLTDLARSIREDYRPSIKVGIGSGLGTSFVNRSLESLINEFPDVRFEFSISTTERILRLLSEERLDLGISVRPPNSQLPIGVAQVDIAEGSMAVVLPAGHPATERSGALDLNDIVNEPIIMNELGIGYSTLVLDIFQAQAAYPRIAAVSDNVDLMLEMVGVGVGLAIVPAMCVHPGFPLALRQRVIIRPLNTLVRVHYAVFHRDKLMPPRVLEVVKTLERLEILK